MDNKILTIMIYDNASILSKIKLNNDNIIYFEFRRDGYNDFLKLNNIYQSQYKKLIYFIYHKNYNNIKKFVRDSDIFIYYTSIDDIVLHNLLVVKLNNE